MDRGFYVLCYDVLIDCVKVEMREWYLVLFGMKAQSDRCGCVMLSGCKRCMGVFSEVGNMVIKGDSSEWVVKKRISICNQHIVVSRLHLQRINT